MSRKKILIWSVLICLASIAGYGGYRALVEKKTKNINSKQHITNIYSNQTGSKGEVSLPNYFLAKKAQYILRKVNLQTRIPNRTSVEPLDYVVAQGDSVFEIARKFNIKPESLLWANYDQLNDNPDVISIGMLLKIPPIDGVYYKVLNGDTLDSAAQKFDAKVADILTWPANQLDLTNPSLSQIPGSSFQVVTVSFGSGLSRLSHEVQQAFLKNYMARVLVRVLFRAPMVLVLSSGQLLIIICQAMTIGQVILASILELEKGQQYMLLIVEWWFLRVGQPAVMAIW